MLAGTFPADQRYSDRLAMLTRDQAQRLTDKILKLSKFPECSVEVTEDERSFVRFANNGVTTSGFTLERIVTIASTRDNKTGVSETTDLADNGLEAAVRRSEDLAAIAPPDPERDHQNVARRWQTRRHRLARPAPSAAAGCDGRADR